MRQNGVSEVSTSCDTEGWVGGPYWTSSRSSPGVCWCDRTVSDTLREHGSVWRSVSSHDVSSELSVSCMLAVPPAADADGWSCVRVSTVNRVLWFLRRTAMDRVMDVLTVRPPDGGSQWPCGMATENSSWFSMRWQADELIPFVSTLKGRSCEMSAGNAAACGPIKCPQQSEWFQQWGAEKEEQVRPQAVACLGVIWSLLKKRYIQNNHHNNLTVNRTLTLRGKNCSCRRKTTTTCQKRFFTLCVSQKRRKRWEQQTCLILRLLFFKVDELSHHEALEDGLLSLRSVTHHWQSEVSSSRVKRKPCGCCMVLIEATLSRPVGLGLISVKTGRSRTGGQWSTGLRGRIQVSIQGRDLVKTQTTVRSGSWLPHQFIFLYRAFLWTCTPLLAKNWSESTD